MAGVESATADEPQRTSPSPAIWGRRPRAPTQPPWFPSTTDPMSNLRCVSISFFSPDLDLLFLFLHRPGPFGPPEHCLCNLARLQAPSRPRITIIPGPAGGKADSESTGVPDSLRPARRSGRGGIQPDGKLLATGGYQEVLIWDLVGGRLYRRIGLGPTSDQALRLRKRGNRARAGDRSRRCGAQMSCGFLPPISS